MCAPYMALPEPPAYREFNWGQGDEPIRVSEWQPPPPLPWWVHHPHQFTGMWAMAIAGMIAIVQVLGW